MNVGVEFSVRAVEFAPTFIFGMERSGTTLLSMMIGAHRQIAVPLATTGMWIDFAERLDAFQWSCTTEDLAGSSMKSAPMNASRLWDAELDRDRLLEDLPLGDYGAVVARFHAEYARAKGKPFWANIDIATLDHMDQVNSWFGNARSCILSETAAMSPSPTRRCPTARETLPNARASGSTAPCNQCQDGTHSWSQARYLTIRFEDLVLDTASFAWKESATFLVLRLISPCCATATWLMKRSLKIGAGCGHPSLAHPKDRRQVSGEAA